MSENLTAAPAGPSLALIVRQARRLIWLAAFGLTAVGLFSVGARRVAWPDTSMAWQSLLGDMVSSGASTSAGLIVASMGVAAALLRRSRRIAEDERRLSRPQGLALGLLFCAFAALMLVSGALNVQGVRRAAEAEQLEQQVAVARLKAEALDAWANERLMALSFLASELGAFPLNLARTRPEVRQVLEVSLAQFMASGPERIGVGVFLADGTPLVSEGQFTPALLDVLKGEVREVLRTQVPAIGKLQPGGRNANGMTLPFIVPLKAMPGSPDGGVVVSLIDPTIAVLRNFGRWPSPSATSEIELLQRDGDQLVHIVTGKQADDSPPLSLRSPVTDDGLIGVRALTQGKGEWNALDHHGKRVLGATYTVSHMPWSVIAKTDMSEALEHVQPEISDIWITTLTTILLGGVITLALGALLLVAEGLSRQRPRDGHPPTTAGA